MRPKFLIIFTLIVCTLSVVGCKNNTDAVVVVDNEVIVESGEDEMNTELSTNHLAPLDKADSDKDISVQDVVSPLCVNGVGLYDAEGMPIQLYGVSTHGINRYPQYVNQESFRTLRDDWGVNCIRLAAYTMERNGYCNEGNKEDIKQTIMRGVDYATRLRMYVIIDWHILSDGNPNQNIDEALIFFDEMSERYRDYPNVIYEICNEPNNTTWNEVKNYALQVIPVIRANSKDAVIIVGTPSWCQDIDEVADDRIDEYSNIIYSVHFYADSHRDINREKLSAAIEKGIPVFCSEFGACGADGNGTYNFEEAKKWLELLDSNNISYCIWNLSNKDEASALVSADCDKLSGWSVDELSGEGQWYRNEIRNKAADRLAIYETLPDYDTGVLLESKTSLSTQDNQSGENNDAVKPANESTAIGKTSTVLYDNLECTVRKDSEWNDGKSYYGQYTITLACVKGTVQDWDINVQYDDRISIDNSWCGSYLVEDNRINVTPADYNSVIKKGENTEIGFIIKADHNLGLPVITSNFQ